VIEGWDSLDRFANIKTESARSVCGVTGIFKQCSSIEYGKWTCPGIGHGLHCVS
jgi:hypothetical protein